MMKRVLVSYHYFAHYRLPILMELSNDKDISFTYISGRTTDEPISIIAPSTANKHDLDWKEVRNIWFFNKKMLWQVGLISECLFGNYNGYIFLGNPYFVSTWVATIILRLMGKPVFFWTHGIVRNKIRDKLKIVYLKLANGLFLYGNWSKNRLIDLGFNPSSLYVIYNSLDFKRQLAIRATITSEMIKQKKESLFTNGDLPILIFIGRLTPQKKLDELINSCEQLHLQGLPVNLLLIGDGEERTKLDKLRKSKNLDDFIVFYGESYNEEEIALLIALADVCVSPGNVGLTAIHALTYGTPVITHNNPYQQMPEYEAIIPGETGMLFEQGSMNSLINSIITWLKLKQNDRELVRLKCYEIVNKYYNPMFQANLIRRAFI